jgi:ubiquitin-like 1-activating enzyme E1 B
MTRPEQARILIVGAGGIGCELLKNAILAGFDSIDLVDLDTIELSNLNRQFLFRRNHIGHSKALVAREVALKMVPSGRSISLQAHFANIMDTEKFPISFFKGFDLVMNALDNLAARQYVNNMCLACRVPLLESGTAGFLGQTSIILPVFTGKYAVSR